jgi:hypothetical protein
LDSAAAKTDPANQVRRFWNPILVGVIAGFGLLAGAATANACSGRDYAYAGVSGVQPAAGVSATVTVLEPPDVFSGHVAAWVGVGGAGAGPAGEDEWIQVGFSGFPGTSFTSLYYEVALPGRAPRYELVESGLLPGATRRISVAEVAGRRHWWRVRVDGRPVGEPVRLPSSDRQWLPMATGESWGGGAGVCNDFRYRFDKVRVTQQLGGAWRDLAQSYRFQDPGYRVERTSGASFVVSRAA